MFDLFAWLYGSILLYRTMSPLAKKSKKKEPTIVDKNGTVKDMEYLDFSESKNDDSDKNDAGKSVIFLRYSVKLN